MRLINIVKVAVLKAVNSVQPEAKSHLEFLNRT